MAAETPRTSPLLLVVDDDPALRDIFEAFMTGEGFAVACAEDGAEGLAKAAELKPAAVVLDLMMPKLNGLEVLRRLQEQGLGGIPVYVATGYGASAKIEEVRKQPNVIRVLDKPLKYPELAAEIRERLAGHGR